MNRRIWLYLAVLSGALALIVLVNPAHTWDETPVRLVLGWLGLPLSAWCLAVWDEGDSR